MRNSILKSAAKLVFLLMAVGATVGLFTGHIQEDNFMILATGAFSFYFSNKGSINDDGSTPPFLGK